jgi:hypothetical protein
MRRGEAGVLMMIQYNQLQIAYMITSKRIVYHNYNATKKIERFTGTVLFCFYPYDLQLDTQCCLSRQPRLKTQTSC